MNLDSNFQRGGGVQTKTPSAGGVCIFSGKNNVFMTWLLWGHEFELEISSSN